MSASASELELRRPVFITELSRLKQSAREEESKGEISFFPDMNREVLHIDSVLHLLTKDQSPKSR